MSELVSGWEILSRRTNQPIRHLLATLLQVVMLSTEGMYSSVTWTVRETATGRTCKVAAHSEQEAREKIASGQFDKE